MFRITEESHQRELYSAWLNITRMILNCPFTWTLSVLWQHILTHCACVQFTECLHIQWTAHTHNRSQYAAITPTLSMSTD